MSGKKLIWGITVCGLILAAAATYVYLDYDSRIYRVCVAEAGSSISVGDFLKKSDVEATLVSNGSYNASRPGEYQFTVKSGLFTYHPVVTVVDTVAPVITVQNVEANFGESISPQDFVTETRDETEVELSLKEAMTTADYGTYPVTIVAEDAGQNVVQEDAILIVSPVEKEITVEYGTTDFDLNSLLLDASLAPTVSYSVECLDTTVLGDASVITTYEDYSYETVVHVVDTVPPVIEGVKDIEIYAGNNISYKSGVKVTDNCDPSPTLDVLSENVAIKTPGTYEITYVARDSSGNETSVTAHVSVLANVYSEEAVLQLARSTLAKMNLDGKSDYEKAQIIYNYVRAHVGFISHSAHDDYLVGAWEGLHNHKGDCFVYYATSKLLLTEAGIQNYDIEKIPSSSRHWWNVINIGEGYRHFDTCPRVGGGVFFYLTDEQMMNYSTSHHNSHNYDRSVYTYFN